MTSEPTVVVHLKEVEVEDRLSESLERRCQALAADFPEVRRFEITIAQDGNLGIEVRGHATGKHTSNEITCSSVRSVASS